MGPIWGRQDPGGLHVAPWTLLSGQATTWTNNDKIHVTISDCDTNQISSSDILIFNLVIEEKYMNHCVTCQTVSVIMVHHMASLGWEYTIYRLFCCWHYWISHRVIVAINDEYLVLGDTNMCWLCNILSYIWFICHISYKHIVAVIQFSDMFIDSCCLQYVFVSTHLPLVPHICVSGSGEHWFK